ncbi:MFS transporter [Pseudoalteromonas denitrificans]|uniref:Predicted arabinose efflux permease, MFS family n=1 Tax=Pseudoalteromonas denitrificans DSM 6059 TaxID=1123010 RepID=A0A1I1EKC1_9GAMM|nr:MFS transporter [Pseudoalteromonas denitrificans]SFB87521.1 Predicted arabinose efflux permease, MFS family [Pseudoalteromonas denitrificans DSM 6059]
MTAEKLKYQRLCTLFLLLASTMTVMAGATLAPALPGMEAAFAQTAQAEFWVKMSLTIPGLVIAICAPFMGVLLDKINNKSVLVGALIFYALTGFSGYLFQDSLVVILMSRIGLGVAVAGIMVSCTILAGEYFKGPKLGQYMGLQAAFGGFGGVAFLSMSGMLAQQNWTYVFFIYLFSLVILPGVMAFLYDPKKQSQAGKTQKNEQALIFDKNKLFSCYGLAVLEILVLYSIVLHLPFMLTSLNLGNSMETGFALAFLMLTMSLVSLGYGVISRYFSIFTLHAFGWLLISFGLLGLSQSNVMETILSALLVTGIGLGLIRPNLFIWLFSFTPLPMRGKVIGGITTCFFIGQFISSIVTEPVVQAYGYEVLFLLIGMLAFILILIICITLFVKKAINKSNNIALEP